MTSFEFEALNFQQKLTFSKESCVSQHLVGRGMSSFSSYLLSLENGLFEWRSASGLAGVGPDHLKRIP